MLPAMRSIAAAAAVLLLTACQADPDKQVALGYVKLLEPLLYENGLLADELARTAAGLHDEEFAPDEVGVTWGTEIAPLAEHLATQASLQVPPVEWAARHEGLVEVWTDRAEAYRGVALALERGDREAWRASREKIGRVMVAQEDWFKQTNEALAPHGLALDQIP